MSPRRMPFLPWWTPFALVVLAFGSCATPKATSGLLEGNLPTGTLARPGDLGFDGLAFPVRQIRLPSGMRLAIEKAPTNGMVGVVMTVGVGASNDPIGKEGLAHLVEHLVFRSRPAPDQPDVGDRLMLLSDSVKNAKTDPDLTTFESAVPKRNLPALLQTFSLLLTTPIQNISDADAATEREIVESEYLLRDETGAAGQIVGWLHQALFAPQHPYARAIGGDAQSASRLTLQDARAFAQQHYRPENATMVLVGEFDPGEVDQLLASMPAVLTEGAGREPARMPFTVLPPQPPAMPPGGPYRYQAAIEHPTVLVAWRLPNVYSQAGALVRIVTSPSGHPVLSRWLHQDADVHSVQIIAREYRQSTMVVCWIELENSRNRDAIATKAAHVFAQVWRPMSVETAERLASKDGRWVDELLNEDLQAMASMREQTAAGVLFSAESFWDRAVDRARFLHLTGDASSYVKTMGQVVNASMDDVATFASQQLSGAGARVIYLDPLPADKRPRPALPGPDQRDIGQVADRPFEAPSFGPPPRLPSPPEFAKAEIYHLDNGLEVALIPRHQFPTVSIALGYNGGQSVSRPPGAARLLRVLESRMQLRDELHALVVDSHDTPDLSMEIIRGGKRNLSNGLMLAAEKLKLADVIPWDEFFSALNANSTQREGLGQATVRPSPSWEASRALRHALYGQHPYGHIVSPADINALTPRDMEQWVLRSRSPRNVVLVIAGDIDVAETRRLVAAWFGDWEVQRGTFEQAVPPVPAPAPGPAHESVLVYPDPGTTQTSIQIGCRLPNGGFREAASQAVLGNLVGGYLRTRIREEAGAAYSISGGAHMFRGGAAHLQLELSVDNARLKDVLRIVRGHWRAFGVGKFDAGALTQIKWFNATAANFRFQTSTDFAVSVLDSLNHGWAIDYPGRSLQHIMAVTTDDLAKAFEVCRASTVLTLVGDPTAIGAANVTPARVPTASR